MTGIGCRARQTAPPARRSLPRPVGQRRRIEVVIRRVTFAGSHGGSFARPSFRRLAHKDRRRTAPCQARCPAGGLQCHRTTRGLVSRAGDTGGSALAFRLPAAGLVRCCPETALPPGRFASCRASHLGQDIFPCFLSQHSPCSQRVPLWDAPGEHRWQWAQLASAKAAAARHQRATFSSPCPPRPGWRPTRSQAVASDALPLTPPSKTAAGMGPVPFSSVFWRPFWRPFWKDTRAAGGGFVGQGEAGSFIRLERFTCAVRYGGAREKALKEVGFAWETLLVRNLLRSPVGLIL